MGKKRYATRFLKEFGGVLRGKSEADAGLTPIVEAFGSALKGKIGKSPGTQPDLPVMADIAPLLQAATADGDEFRDLLLATYEQVQWFVSYPNGGGSDDLASTLVGAQVVGPLGLLHSENLMTGYFLIGANTHYPLHDHLSDELYYVVSGSVEIQNGFEGAPRLLHAGDYSITPPSVPHRLQSGDAPVMILYAWTGAIDCEVFWWEDLGDEHWRRFQPRRTLNELTRNKQ